ncbi:MAG: DNA/RNA helicase domain-containing protein [Betaproteobacteria bacterium]
MNISDVSAQSPLRFSRAWYSATLAEFLETQADVIVGRLATNGDFSLLLSQRDAWLAQITFLQENLLGLSGALFLEFNIPRMGRRIDAVLLIGPVVFVVEFNVGESAFERSAVAQVWDYALDLKNFHEASHSAAIVPILIATGSTESARVDLHVDEDKVYRPILICPNDFRKTIERSLRTVTGEALDEQQWSSAPYRPTPTIIEAARALYAHHSVEAIARYDAGAQNLRVTSSRIEELVDEARTERRKAICFVTGVPGAGKTLVGLNIATQRRDVDQPTHAVFLSGNGPLVAVLREALTRDEMERERSYGNRVRKGQVGEKVKAFIQNVHNFRDEALFDPSAPPEHVVIFDEAQRAWNLKKTADFMSRRKKRPGFSNSEPEFLISCMDRHPEWAVIVCLVGGGQEIHTGEAGIDEWLDAVNSRFPDWHMHISSRLTDSEYAAGKALDAVRQRQNTHFDDSLHLAVSMRSFRAENVSAFVKSLLDCEKQQAREAFAQLVDRYPIVITRDLNRAKQWIRNRARGTERFGLVASSKAQRLKPHAIDIRVDVDPVHWFLDDKDDTRSSYYLEDAATEFQVQGLELDWTCVSWDGDLRFTDSEWTFHDFRGDRWCNIANIENRRYLRNAYRVLLTRARQGMVVFVPPGDSIDPTRLPEFYDSTFKYLTELGIPTVS